MFTVVGKIRKNGNFNGLEYDNTFLHCTRVSLPQSGESGTMVEIIKVKTDLAKSFDIGDNINVYYDKYGKVASIVAL